MIKVGLLINIRPADKNWPADEKVGLVIKSGPAEKKQACATKRKVSVLRKVNCAAKSDLCYKNWHVLKSDLYYEKWYMLRKLACAPESGLCYEKWPVL